MPKKTVEERLISLENNVEHLHDELEDLANEFRRAIKSLRDTIEILDEDRCY